MFFNGCVLFLNRSIIIAKTNKLTGENMKLLRNIVEIMKISRFYI